MDDNEGTQDDKGTEGTPPENGAAPAGGPDDATKGEEGKPNGKPADDAKGGDGTDWKARARQHEDGAKAARKQAADALADRDKLAGVLDGLRKALDPDGAGKDAPPEELAKVAAQERDAARAEVKLARVELAAERSARRAGADVDALLDSRTFLAKLADLDPTDDGFAAAVDDAVKAALKDRPGLKAKAPAPPAGNADMSGGGGGSAPRSGNGSRIDQIRKDRTTRRH